MPLYECVLIARNDVTQQQVEGIADGIATQLETEGGEMKKREYGVCAVWPTGSRRTARATTCCSASTPSRPSSPRWSVSSA